MTITLTLRNDYAERDGIIEIPVSSKTSSETIHFKVNNLSATEYTIGEAAWDIYGNDFNNMRYITSLKNYKETYSSQNSYTIAEFDITFNASTFNGKTIDFYVPAEHRGGGYGFVPSTEVVHINFKLSDTPSVDEDDNIPPVADFTLTSTNPDFISKWSTAFDALYITKMQNQDLILHVEATNLSYIYISSPIYDHIKWTGRYKPNEHHEIRLELGTYEIDIPFSIDTSSITPDEYRSAAYDVRTTISAVGYTGTSYDTVEHLNLYIEPPAVLVSPMFGGKLVNTNGTTSEYLTQQFYAIDIDEFSAVPYFDNTLVKFGAYGQGSELFDILENGGTWTKTYNGVKQYDIISTGNYNFRFANINPYVREDKNYILPEAFIYFTNHLHYTFSKSRLETNYKAGVLSSFKATIDKTPDGIKYAGWFESTGHTITTTSPWIDVSGARVDVNEDGYIATISGIRVEKNLDTENGRDGIVEITFKGYSKKGNPDETSTSQIEVHQDARPVYTATLEVSGGGTAELSTTSIPSEESTDIIITSLTENNYPKALYINGSRYDDLLEDLIENSRCTILDVEDNLDIRLEISTLEIELLSPTSVSVDYKAQTVEYNCRIKTGTADKNNVVFTIPPSWIIGSVQWNGDNFTVKLILGNNYSTTPRSFDSLNARFYESATGEYFDLNLGTITQRYAFRIIIGTDPINITSGGDWASAFNISNPDRCPISTSIPEEDWWILGADIDYDLILDIDRNASLESRDGKFFVLFPDGTTAYTVNLHQSGIEVSINQTVYYFKYNRGVYSNILKLTYNYGSDWIRNGLNIKLKENYSWIRLNNFDATVDENTLSTSRKAVIQLYALNEQNVIGEYSFTQHPMPTSDIPDVVVFSLGVGGTKRYNINSTNPNPRYTITGASSPFSASISSGVLSVSSSNFSSSWDGTASRGAMSIVENGDYGRKEYIIILALYPPLPTISNLSNVSIGGSRQSLYKSISGSYWTDVNVPEITYDSSIISEARLSSDYSRLDYTVLENSELESRDTEISISITNESGTTTKSFTISQTGRPYLDDVSLSCGFDAAVLSTNLRKQNSSDKITVVSNVSWASATVSSSGVVSVNVSKNILTSQREGTIDFILYGDSKATLQIIQRGFFDLIFPSLNEIDYRGGDIEVLSEESINVVSASVVSSSSWLKNIEVGTNSLVCTVDKNTERTPRKGTIQYNISNGTDTYKKSVDLVWQTGYPRISISSLSGSFNASGQTRSITVSSTDVAEGISVDTSASWISANLSGNTCTITVSGNSSSVSRTGYVYFYADDIETPLAKYTVSQDAGYISISPSYLSDFASTGGKQTITVSTSSSQPIQIDDYDIYGYDFETSLDGNRIEITVPGNKYRHEDDDIDSLYRGMFIIRTGGLTKFVYIHQTNGYLRLSKTSHSFSPDAGSTTITVDKSFTSPVLYSTSSDWVRIENINDSTIKVSVEPNLTGTSRTASVRLYSTDSEDRMSYAIPLETVFNISQGNGRLDVSPAFITMPWDGSSKVIDVERNIYSEDFSVSCDADWITFTPNQEWNRITVEAEPNEGPQREATVRVSIGSISSECKITQEELTCSLNPTSISLTSSNSVNKTVLMTTNFEGVAYASSYPDWCSVSVNDDNTAISITVLSNTNYGSSRDGDIQIKLAHLTKTIHIHQPGSPKITLSADSGNISNLGGELTVGYTSTLDGESRPITVSSDVPWANAVVNGGNIKITVDSNDTAYDRTGNIKVVSGESEVVYTITQDKTPYLNINPSGTKSIGYERTYITVSASTNSDSPVECSVPDPCTVERTGDVFKITVPENPLSHTRTFNAVFSVSGVSKTLVISQSGQETYSIGITILDAARGTVVEGADVFIYEGSVSGPLVYEKLNSTGNESYSHIGTSPKMFSVVVDCDGYERGEASILSTTGTLEYTKIYLRKIEEYYVSIDVKDTSGNLIQFSKYTLTDERGSISSTGISDSGNIRYHYSGSSRQNFTYLIEKSGYISKTGTVQSDTINNPISVYLSAAETYTWYVRFSVLDSSGNPLGGVGYSIWSGESRVASGTTSSDGLVNYSYVGAESRRFTYTIEKSGYSGTTGTIDSTTSASYNTVRLTESIEQYYFSIFVKDSRNNPIGNAYYTIFNSNGVEVLSGYTQSTGILTFPVSSGKYRYQISKSGYTAKEGELDASTSNTPISVVLTAEQLRVILDKTQVELPSTGGSAVIGYSISSGVLDIANSSIASVSPSSLSAELNTTLRTITITGNPTTSSSGSVLVRFRDEILGTDVYETIYVFFNTNYISSGISEWRPGSDASSTTSTITWSGITDVPTITSSNPGITAEWVSTSSESGVIRISVNENTQTTPRTGTITLSGVSSAGQPIQRVIDIIQSGSTKETWYVNINVVDEFSRNLGGVGCSLIDGSGNTIKYITGSSNESRLEYSYQGASEAFRYRLSKYGYITKEGTLYSRTSSLPIDITLERAKSAYYCNILVLDRKDNSKIDGADYTIKSQSGSILKSGKTVNGSISYSVSAYVSENITVSVRKAGYVSAEETFTTSLDTTQNLFYLNRIEQVNLDITFPGEEYPYYGSAEVIKYSITKGTATDVKVVSQSPWISKVSVDLEGKTVRFTTTDNTTVGYRSGSITISFYDPARSGWVDFVVPVKQAGYDSEGRIYIPTWANTYVEIPSSSYWTVEADGEVIYSGRTAVEPGKTKAVVEVSGIFKNYIKPTMDFGDTGTVVDNNEDKSFKIYAYSGSNPYRKTQVAEFMAHNDWSYDASMNYNTKNSDGIILSEPVNGHFDYRMYFLFTGYQSGSHPGVWYSYVKRSGAFLDSWNPSFGSVGGNYTHTFEISGVSPNATSVHFDNPDIQSGITYDKPVCGCKYALYYRNRKGGFDSFLIEGSSKVIDNIDRYTIESVYSSRNPIEFGTKNFNKSITTKYELNTGMLTDEEAKRLAFNLIPSSQVWLHNLETDEISSVVITNSEAEYKTWKTESNKLVSYKLTVERSQKRNFL